MAFNGFKMRKMAAAFSSGISSGRVSVSEPLKI
jgi:hypothetical protein